MLSKRALALLLLSLPALGDSPVPISVKAAGGGYHECFGRMQGHAEPAPAIEVCAEGDGDYADFDRVIETLTKTDWFPVRKFPPLTAEVRVVCGGGAEAAVPRVAFAAKGETGRRLRVELPCALDAPKAAKAMKAARNLVLQALKNPPEFLRRAAAATLPGCVKTTESEPCKRFGALIGAIIKGEGSESVNGRPFQFALGGIRFRAGLAAHARKLNDDLNSPDPATRIRAVLSSRGQLDDREWSERLTSAFDRLSREAQVKLVEDTIDDPDAAVRAWAVGSIGLLSPEKRDAVAARAVDDADPGVRSRAIPYAVRLGETYALKAIHDADSDNRMLAFDLLTGTDAAAGRVPASQGATTAPPIDDKTIRYLELGLTDTDEAIRLISQGRLDYINQQRDLIRAGKPGWEDGQGLRETSGSPATR